MGCTTNHSCRILLQGALSQFYTAVRADTLHSRASRSKTTAMRSALVRSNLYLLRSARAHVAPAAAVATCRLVVAAPPAAATRPAPSFGPLFCGSIARGAALDTARAQPSRSFASELASRRCGISNRSDRWSRPTAPRRSQPRQQLVLRRRSTEIAFSDRDWVQRCQKKFTL